MLPHAYLPNIQSDLGYDTFLDIAQLVLYMYSAKLREFWNFTKATSPSW